MEKKQLELPTGLKVDFIEAAEVAKVKLQGKKGQPKISDTAIAMFQKLSKDLGSGAKIALNNKALQDNKDTIRKLVQRDLQKLLHHDGKKNYAVRVTERENELFFYVEPKRTVSVNE